MAANILGSGLLEWTVTSLKSAPKATSILCWVMLSSGVIPVVLTGAAPKARRAVDDGVLNAAGTILPISNISFFLENSLKLGDFEHIKLPGDWVSRLLYQRSEVWTLNQMNRATFHVGHMVILKMRHRKAEAFV